MAGSVGRLRSRGEPVKIVLVNMPWHALRNPSLALGILTAETARHRPDVGVESVFANVAWAEYLLRQTGGDLGPGDYSEAGADQIFEHVGEWVFASALYGRAWKVAEFSEFLESRDVELAKFVRMHALAPAFIEDTVRDIVDREPDIVGFTTTFQQNVPSPAAARRLKELAPGVVTVFGGSNCDGSQGVAIARNFAFVDYVLRGEGERSFLALVSAPRSSCNMNGTFSSSSQSGGRGACSISSNTVSTIPDLAPEMPSVRPA